MEGFVIYWLISQNRDATYVGYSDDVIRRIDEHRNGKVKTTKGFGNFEWYVLEKVTSLQQARKRERYWKSHAGRKKLAHLYGLIV